MRHFQIGNLDAAGWQSSRQLPLADFGEAAAAAVARTTGFRFSHHAQRG